MHIFIYKILPSRNKMIDAYKIFLKKVLNETFLYFEGENCCLLNILFTEESVILDNAEIK